MVKSIYVNIILNGEKLECFLPKIKNKSRIPTLITSTEHCTRSSRQCNQARKRKTKYPNWKGRDKIHYMQTVKAMVFPVVRYRCEGWTIKKAEQQKPDAFKL